MSLQKIKNKFEHNFDDMIYALTKGDYTIEHRRFVNFEGFLVDDFLIRHCPAEGKVRIYPMIAKMKIRDYDPNENLFNQTTNYTNKEYEEMLDEEIKKIKKLPLTSSEKP